MMDKCKQDDFQSLTKKHGYSVLFLTTKSCSAKKACFVEKQAIWRRKEISKERSDGILEFILFSHKHLQSFVITVFTRGHCLTASLMRLLP